MMSFLLGSPNPRCFNLLQSLCRSSSTSRFCVHRVSSGWCSLPWRHEQRFSTSKPCYGKTSRRFQPPDGLDGGKEPPFLIKLRKGNNTPPQTDSQYQKYQTGKKKRGFKVPNIIQQNPTAVFVLGLGSLLMGYSYYFLQQQLREQELELVKMSTAEQQQAAIGGDWELVNTDGKTVTNKDYEGHWCIVYFGFTHCPDICPDEIEKIVEVTNILERDNSLPKIVPIFVTIDPDRDTPAIIKDYLADFGPNLVGLSGSWEQLRVILKEFKVYYSKGPVDEDGDYIVDHSIITFLMNPEGKMAAYFPRSKTNIEIATHIRKLMKSYKQIYKTS